MKSEEIFIAAGRPARRSLGVGGLRPFWRFLISSVAVVLAFLSLSLLPHVQRLGRPIQSLLEDAWLAVALLLAFKALTKFLDRKPLKSIGLALYSRWWLDLGIGLGLGAAMILAVAISERLLGLVVFSRNPQPAGEVGLSGLFFFALLLLAAINEELAFRGYPFQRLVESIGPVAAVVVLSALFGIVHLGNPGHTWISTINTALVGIPLSVAYLRTRALWLSIALHFSWNFLLGYGLGLPVSGFRLARSVLVPKVHGAGWLTGADYGPEASVVATVVILAATLYLSVSKRIYTSEEMRALTAGAPRPA